MPGAVNIVFFVEERRYFYFDYLGSYFNAGSSLERLNKILTEVGLSDDTGDTFCIWQDDPDVIPVDKLRSKVCVLVTSDLQCPPELEVGYLPPGKYAQMIYEGDYESVGEYWKFFYGVWLPHSGYEVRRNVPAFEVYPSRRPGLSPSEKITELYICLT